MDLQLIVFHTWNSSSNSFKSMWFNSPERKNADANQTPSSSVDLVIGFGGNSTLPQEVTPAIVGFIKAVAVDQITDPWEAAVHTFGCDLKLLDTTPVVAIYKSMSTSFV